MSKIYKEYDRKYSADPVKFPASVYASRLRETTEQEVQLAKDEYDKIGECDHSYIMDTDAWPYYSRKCVICGCGLGLV